MQFYIEHDVHTIAPHSPLYMPLYSRLRRMPAGYGWFTARATCFMSCGQAMNSVCDVRGHHTCSTSGILRWMYWRTTGVYETSSRAL